MSTIDDLLNAKKISDIKMAPANQNQQSDDLSTSKNDDTLVVDKTEDHNESSEVHGKKIPVRQYDSVLDDFEIKEEQSVPVITEEPVPAEMVADTQNEELQSPVIVEEKEDIDSKLEENTSSDLEVVGEPGMINNRQEDARVEQEVVPSDDISNLIDFYEPEVKKISDSIESEVVVNIDSESEGKEITDMVDSEEDKMPAESVNNISEQNELLAQDASEDDENNEDFLEQIHDERDHKPFGAYGESEAKESHKDGFDSRADDVKESFGIDLETQPETSEKDENLKTVPVSAEVGTELQDESTPTESTADESVKKNLDIVLESQPEDVAEKHNVLKFDESEHILNDKMHEIDLKEKEQEVEAKALARGLGYINFKGVPIAAENLQKIPFEMSEQKKIICFYYAHHNKARIAVTEENIEKSKEIEQGLPKEFRNVEIEWFLVSEESFQEAYKQYGNLPKIKEIPKGVHIEGDEFTALYESIKTLQDIDQKVKNVSTTQMITLFIAAGVKLGSSDIHIEAEADGVKLRYRIDGILQTASVLDRDLWEKINARIKLLANLKLNVSFEPQDGRFSIFLPEEKIDVRLSCLPTNYGESVVMRLLRSKSINVDFKTIGLSEKYFKMLTREISRPNGMIITTGPTGSGKTTTLYSILKELNKPEVKIITVEDPIEYELGGINQSQIDHKKGYDFSKGLRSILRQDPDVVMVGEMRDLETVDIALNAALTGHLVLSTIHTNTAAGAVQRFMAMGAKPYLLAPALNLVMAQRLARKLCDHCQEEYQPTGDEMERVKKALEQLPEDEKQNIDINNLLFKKAKGCPECNNLGYKGRVGLFEMFNMTPEIEQVILSDEVSEYKIEEIAKKNGMTTMLQDGILKALKGVTSLEEVFRVIE